MICETLAPRAKGENAKRTRFWVWKHGKIRWIVCAGFFFFFGNPSSRFRSSVFVQHQDTCPGHPECHISLTLTSAASLAVSPGTLPPGRGAPLLFVRSLAPSPSLSVCEGVNE